MAHKTTHNVSELLLDGRRIEAALRKASRNALLAHKREGVPLPVWKDGTTVWIPPEEIEVPEEESEAEVEPAIPR